MQTLRRSLVWVYALVAVTCLRVGLWPLSSHRSASVSNPRSFLVPLLFVALGVLFGTAFWTNLRSKASARVWGLAAGIANTLFALLPTLLAHHPLNRCTAIVLSIGVLGIVAFVRRSTAAIQPKDAKEDQSMPGDWTCNPINKLAGAILFGLSLSAYFWWTAWMSAKGVEGLSSGWRRLLMNLAVVLAITTIHELGHMAAGLACGMRLRSFISGPFQWRVREGKWEFKFSAKGLILPEGATGVVSSSGDIQRGQYIAMMSAGSLMNLLTGVFALMLASRATPAAPIQAGGVLALFGAFSIALAAGNLLPFRTGNCYSDGACLMQLLSRGPWADFHLAVAAIGSSQVSSLRPRDYDILAIQRAAAFIRDGRQGLLLRLFAFYHYLDCGRIKEAEEAIAEAELIYHESASDIPAELHSVFVFANAYLRRDPAAARAWFDRMQSKNPTRFNPEYWRAHSALHWIEGDLNEADAAWEKCDRLAKQLPRAGAYEFDRYCCSLLRRALDEAPLAA
jgi:hypothetical protein